MADWLPCIGFTVLPAVGSILTRRFTSYKYGSFAATMDWYQVNFSKIVIQTQI